MIKPLKNNVLIKIHEIDQTTIAMVDDEEARVEKATVLAIGDEVESVQVDDVIYFKKYNLDTIVDGDDVYNLIPEEDIKGIYVSLP